ncbi:hypothetical protein FRB94_009726 [Tulasnella sp. JGI-2019a]|nr:hypothetical protein FRB94_009726 [Tulasnella sp. JGI-2019a]
MASLTNTQDDEIPATFGAKNEYWTKYRVLADQMDDIMIERLNRNLDNLLIFAGLFSGLNTAFLVLTLSNLSAPAMNQTNALLILLVMHANNRTIGPNDLNPPFTPSRASIRQNGTFVASLCISILAAAGAVLAKEWLQNYERTEQGGLDKGQALRRTARWIGVDGWMLLPVVQSLPTILLFSLALFFVALCDYLSSISKPVAAVVILFVLVGAASYIFTVVAAVFDRACPFQTAVSRILRHIIRGGGKLAEEASRWSSIGHTFWDEHMHGFTWSFDSHDGKITEREQDLYVKFTLWMLEFATEEDDVLSVAANTPTIRDLKSTKDIATSPLSTKLVQHFKKSIAVISRGTDIDARAVTIPLQSALALALAVTHIFLADSLGIDRVAARELSALVVETASIRRQKNSNSSTRYALGC